MSIESVAAELRTLRRRIDNQLANPHDWPTKEEELAADLDRYDRRMLKAAAMLQLHLPPRSRGSSHLLLSDGDRGTVEQLLAEAGLDVRAPAPDEDLQA